MMPCDASLKIFRRRAALAVAWLAAVEAHAAPTVAAEAGTDAVLLAATLGAGLVAGAAVMWWWAGRTFARRAQQAEEREWRERTFFELAPMPVMVQDVAEIAERLAGWRRDGVRDLRAHLAAEPGRVEELFRMKRVVRANRAALEASGFATSGEMDRGFRTVMTAQALRAFEDELDAIWDERTSLVVEKLYRLHGGRELHTLMNWSVDRIAGHLDYGQVRLVFTDITEIKAAQRALHESEERYRNLFETTPNPLYIFDAESLQFLMVNQAAVKRYGYSREEFRQMTVLDLRPPEEAERLTRAMQEFRSRGAQSGPHEAGLWQHRCRNGTILTVEVYTHSLRFNGRAAVLALPFDISAMVAAERAVRDSEVRYRELFEHAVGGVYRSTAEGCYIEVNAALARLYGFTSPTEMMAWNEKERGGVAYGDEEEHARFIALIERDGKVENFESRIRDRHGRIVWVSESTRAVRDGAGKLLYYEGLVTDITARRQLEAEMLRASKLEAIGILAGGIAHDFNNLMTVVLGNVVLAQAEMAEDDPLRPLLHDAKRATLRARDLTLQLLTFAKGGDPVRAAVPLAEVLREAAEFGMHGQKSRLEIDLPRELWPANVDRGQIGQVVQNLVINAVQAMPDGGVVRISGQNCIVHPGNGLLLAGGDYVKLSVADTGMGIPPEHVEKIFDPYFTTKPQGTGLGLATVYSIMRKHQGQVEVDSRPGRGTTFHLWLPAALAADVPPKVEAVDDRKLPTRVLFMDDEEAIRVMAQTFIRRMGAQATGVADGAEAIVAYREAMEAGRPFDVVVMDLTVPGGMGGREALERLRSIDPGVRAIVSSGYSSDPVLANFQQHGFCGILPKPYDPEQLRRALQEALAGPGDRLEN